MEGSGGSRSAPVPTAIRQAGPLELEIAWSDGHVSVYPALLLRRACPCALCVDEWTGERRTRPEDIPDDIRPQRIEPVGRYALSLRWSDGHDTGIYSFELLRALCPCQACQGT